MPPLPPKKKKNKKNKTNTLVIFWLKKEVYKVLT